MQAWEVALLISAAAFALLCGYLVSAIKELRKTLTKVNTILDDNSQNIKDVITNLSGTLNEAKGAAGGVNTVIGENKETISSIISGVDSSVKNVSNITSGVNDLTDKVKNTAQSVSESVGGVKKITKAASDDSAVSTITGIKKAISYAGMAIAAVKAFDEYRDLKAEKKARKQRKKQK